MRRPEPAPRRPPAAAATTLQRRAAETRCRTAPLPRPLLLRKCWAIPQRSSVETPRAGATATRRLAGVEAALAARPRVELAVRVHRGNSRPLLLLVVARRTRTGPARR